MEDKLWLKMDEIEGREKRIDKAIEELDELIAELEIIKYSFTEKLSEKQRSALVDELADVSMMIDSIMTIYKLESGVELRKLAKTEIVKNIAYPKRRLGVTFNKREVE